MVRTNRRWNLYDDEFPDDGVDPIPPLHDKYHPSEQDIAEVRHILKGFKLPTEVIDFIQEEARYWCRLLARRNDKPLVHSLRTNTGLERKCHYLISPAIPSPPAEKGGTAQVKVKEVVFWIRSRDQGEWDTEGEVFPTAFPGTYANSWTWFEACIYRPIAGDAREDADSTDLAQRLGTSASDDVLDAESIQRVHRPGTNDGESSGTWHLQSNISESSQVKMHKVVWTDEVAEEDEESDIIKETGAGKGAGFVSSLKAGDRVVVLSCKESDHVRIMNRVREAAVEIFYTIS